MRIIIESTGCEIHFPSGCGLAMLTNYVRSHPELGSSSGYSMDGGYTLKFP